MQIGTAIHSMTYKTLLILAVLMVMGLTERTATADPLVFSNVAAFQNNDTTTVDLYSNPGVTLLGSNLTFRIDIAGSLSVGAVDVLRITYTELGSSPIVQNFQIPLFGIEPPLTLIVSILSQATNPQGVPATLTVDLLNSVPDFVIPGGPNEGQTVNSYTYSFNVQPVPEPATLLALAGGLTALVVRVRRRE